MTKAQDRYDTAAQRHSDALQRAIAQATNVVSLAADKAQLTTELAKAQSDYDALLEMTADYLDAATSALENAAKIPAAQAPSGDPTTFASASAPAASAPVVSAATANPAAPPQ